MARQGGLAPRWHLTRPELPAVIVQQKVSTAVEQAALRSPGFASGTMRQGRSRTRRMSLDLELRTPDCGSATIADVRERDGRSVGAGRELNSFGIDREGDRAPCRPGTSKLWRRGEPGGSPDRVPDRPF